MEDLTPESGLPDASLQNTAYRLLLIDDDADFSELMRAYLATYSISLDCELSGMSGLERALAEQPDLILLDMLLPDIHGMEVLRRLRQESGVPVIILSAFNEETDRIVTLEMGADDYVPKFFSPRELLARIRVVLRRRGETPAQSANQVIHIRGFKLDPDTREASLDGTVLEFTHQEFNLLQILLSAPGRVFSREAILAGLDGPDIIKTDRSIDVHIAAIRKKLGDDPRNPVYLKTVRGAGYAFLK